MNERTSPVLPGEMRHRKELDRPTREESSSAFTVITGRVGSNRRGVGPGQAGGTGGPTALSPDGSAAELPDDVASARPEWHRAPSAFRSDCVTIGGGGLNIRFSFFL